MRLAIKMSLMSSVLLVTACHSIMPEQPGDPLYAVTEPNPKQYAPKRNGSLYSETSSMALFETIRARRVGDILTVTLDEKFTGTKKATSTGKKTNNTNISNATAFGQPFEFANGKNLEFKLDSSQNFNGEGESKQNNQLQGTISVTVYDVLSNGDLKIRGEKWLQINRGDEFVRIIGTVRPADIRPDNSISSQRIANARISYSGTGQVADTNRQGWLGRFFNSRWWPY